MKRVLFISSEGGHLHELRQLNIEDYDYCIVTEKTEATKNLQEQYESGRVNYLAYETRKRPFRYFFVLIYNFFKSLKIYFKFKPQVIVTTGTHTAVEMCYIGKIFGAKVIWIETFANRHSKTLAGRLVYPIADTFVVQWKEMKEIYPKSVYWGSIY